MVAIPLPTFFAPAELADEQVLRAQHDMVGRQSLVGVLLDSFPEGAVVLNAQRQIVFANDKVASFLAVSRDALVGLRLGVALNCVHAHERPAGCGTTEACRYCGAAQAMETSRLNQTKVVQECRVLLSAPSSCSALELRVWAAPIELNGEQFTILALRDIADEKRRQVLERIFFHDVMNLAGGLHGVLELLSDPTGDRPTELAQLAAFQAEQLVEEISCQRDLAAAEQGELSVTFKRVDVRGMLDRLGFLYRHHPVAAGKALVIEGNADPHSIQTDPILLRRVLGNLIKNALEAAQPGETVTVCYAPGPEEYSFAVHNDAVMDEAVRSQLFQRSFSTKSGTGRGLGSYSVKLLTERYLQGQVAFESVPGQGTTFRVMFPQLPAEDVERVATTALTHHTVAVPALPSAVNAALAPLRILLAEDNPVNQQVALGLLRKLGHNATLATNGKEVLAALDRAAFDVILMDVQMPEMDGYETTAQIRSREVAAGGHVMIVAMTAHATKGDRERCRAAGMDDHVGKPVKAAELTAVLGRVAQQGTDSPQSQPPVLDPAALARLRGLTDDGGSTFLAAVMEAFFEDSRARLADLREAARAADPERLRKASHALKGAGGEVGARRVGAICQQLEDLGGRHSTAGADALVEQLGQELQKVEVAIQQQLREEQS